MKKRILMTALYTLGMLALSGAAVLLIGRMAAAGWQLPVMQSAPANGSSAVEQVENELKAYPYQVLTRSAAEILYKEIAAAGDALTVRTDGEDCISAAEAAALAGGLAETLYGSDLSEKTMDLVPAVYHGADGTLSAAIWLAAYTLPDAVQTAADGSTPPETQGCWLFCLDAADGSLLFSRCTAAEGERDKTAPGPAERIDDDAMLLLYERTLALGEALGLKADAFTAHRLNTAYRGGVLCSFLRLEDGRICRMIFDEEYRTDSLYELIIAEQTYLPAADDIMPAQAAQPRSLSWLSLPLALSQENGLPAAEALAEAQPGRSTVYAQNTNYPVEAEGGFYLYEYMPDLGGQLLTFLDANTAVQRPACEKPGCTHSTPVECPARPVSSPAVVSDADGSLYYVDDGYYTLDHFNSIKYGAVRKILPQNGSVFLYSLFEGQYYQSAIADSGTVYAVSMRRTGEGTQAAYTLESYTPPAGNAGSTQWNADDKPQTLAQLPGLMFFGGVLDEYLLLTVNHWALKPIQGEHGLQPRDAGWMRSWFAFSTQTHELTRLYTLPDTQSDFVTASDVRTGRLWQAALSEGVLTLQATDLFTGKQSAAIAPVRVPLGEDTRLSELFQTKDHLLLTFWKENRLHYLVVELGTGSFAMYPAGQNFYQIAGSCGDELLIKAYEAEGASYFFLSLPELLHGRTQMRPVQKELSPAK